MKNTRTPPTNVFFTPSEIISAKLGRYYPELKNTVKIKEDASDIRRGYIWAPTPFRTANIFNWWRYTYGTQYLVSDGVVQEEPWAGYGKFTFKNIQTLPIKFTSSKIGPEEFTLADILDVEKKRAALWAATLEPNGILTFTAKSDLGNVSMENTDTVKKETKTVSSYFQQPFNTMKFWNIQDAENPKYRVYRAEKFETRPIRRSVYKFKVQQMQSDDIISAGLEQDPSVVESVQMRTQSLRILLNPAMINQ